MHKSGLIFLDWFSLNLIYLSLYFVVNGTLHLHPSYAKLLLLMNGVWLLLVLAEDKFSLRRVFGYSDIFIKLTRNTLLMLFITSLTVVLLSLYDFQRLQILGTYAILLAVELIVTGIYYPQLHRRIEANQAARSHRPWSLAFMIADLELYLFLFFLVHYIKYDTVALDTRAWQTLAVMLGFWLLSAQWTGKFEKRTPPNIFHGLEPILKSTFIMASAASLMIYSFQLFHFSRTLLLAPVALLMLIEIVILTVWMQIRSVTELQDEHADLDQINHLFAEEELIVTPAASFQESARWRLHHFFEANNKPFFDLIAKYCDLDPIEVTSLTILNTPEPEKVQALPARSLQMVINLQRVNDIRHVNTYLFAVHKKLVHGGYCIGVVDPIETRMDLFHKKYPKYMARCLYLLDFIYRRVIPKTPWLKKFYFALSKGRNRLLSKAEILGRLSYCGFRVLAAEQLDAQLVFIAQKDKPAVRGENPAYGLLVKLNRIGYQGRLFTLYKIRTMYPYSEYIQGYVYRTNRLDENGKFRDDYRLTSWGKVLRKYWLDELPQLYNYVHGDVKIFGARALSEHYFSLYPRDLQELRIRFKPGLIPPYYADMPSSLQEIIESERRYFQEKLLHPWRTDWRYFFRAVHNIFFKNARSR